MRAKVLMVLGAVLAMMVAAAPAQAIKGGVPDDGAHPYVGQLLFYDPTATDPRFDDPGGWFNCSRHAGQPDDRGDRRALHFGTGTNGDPTPAGSGGNDVLDQLRGGAGLQHPAPERELHPRRQRGPLRRLVDSAERVRRMDPGHRLPAPRVRRRRVLHPRPGRAAAQRAGSAATSTASCRRWACSTSCTPRTSSSSTPRSATAWRAQARRPRSAATPGGGPSCGWSTSTASSGSARARRRSSPATPTPAAPASATPAGRSSSPGHRPSSRSCRSATSSTCSGTSGAYRIDQADDLAFLKTFGITP